MGGRGGGVEILLVASCYRNRGKLRPDGPLDSYADFTFFYQIIVQIPEPEMGIFYPLSFHKLSDNWMLDSFLHSLETSNDIWDSKQTTKLEKLKLVRSHLISAVSNQEEAWLCLPIKVIMCRISSTIITIHNFVVELITYGITWFWTPG